MRLISEDDIARRKLFGTSRHPGQAQQREETSLSGEQSKQEEEIFRLSRLRMGNRLLSCTSDLDTDRARSQSGVEIGTAASNVQHGSRVLLYCPVIIPAISDDLYGPFQKLLWQVRVLGDTSSSETGIATDRIVHVVCDRTKNNVRSRASGQSDLVYITGRSDLD